MTTKKRKRKTAEPQRNSYKDVLVLYMKSGVGAVQALFEAKQVGARVLRKALREMPEGKGEDLRQYVDAHVPMIHEGRGRGRALPIPGEVREYRVQQLKDGQLFIRLPVEPLEGMCKGAKIRVAFAKHEILASVG